LRLAHSVEFARRAERFSNEVARTLYHRNSNCSRSQGMIHPTVACRPAEHETPAAGTKCQPGASHGKEPSSLGDRPASAPERRRTGHHQ
jgi:hypothetical protein